MNYEFRIGKNIIIIVLFLFLFGIVIELSQTNYLTRLNTGNEEFINNQEKQTSALSPGDQSHFRQEKTLIVMDSAEEDSKDLKENLAMTLDYLKKSYKVIPVSELPKTNLGDYKDILIAFTQLDKVKNINRLFDYVHKGGSLFFTERPDLTNNFFASYRTMGIYEYGEDDVDNFGVKLDNTDLLLKQGNLKITSHFLSNNSVPVQLDNTCKVYAHTINGVPLLWSRQFGQGRVMVFNGTMLSDKLNRGVITGALSYLNDNYIYPVINSKVVYIDDFPAPFPEGYNKGIYHDYKRNIATFFRDIWWTDMERIAAKSNVKYTGVLIETYNNHVSGSFEDEAGKENLRIFGRDLIKSGGEIGIHGYNHQPLTKDKRVIGELGYKVWPNEKNMEESLKETLEYFHKVFPNYTVHTYVPPSNIISEEGKKALHKAMPSINVLASVYIGDEENLSYAQELENKKPFIELPRFSSDYHYNDNNKWLIANASTLFGAFTHFVHPDDILDKERSEGDNWEELSKQFNQMLADVNNKYPWMKAMNASESAVSFENYAESKVFISHKQDSIQVYINHFKGSLDFMLRSDKTLKGTSGCTVEKVSSDHYLVHAKADKFEIQLGGKQ